ncbi:uncharacterized protein TrAtP1_004433 [Trichoderma atroviride]|uniref:uncharacterized protein n=1 Tax=Hypocrea atroviridis TaxID=63577 RepID=UPI00331CCE7D|nr:hypothetical protein TrAtP1_004433 [Trichoderma atroviride]
MRISARINHTCGALEAGTRKDPPLWNQPNPSKHKPPATDSQEKKARRENSSSRGKGGEARSTEARPAHLWLSTICHSSSLSLKGGSAKGSPFEAGEAPNLAKNLGPPSSSHIHPRRKAATKSDSCSPTAQSEAGLLSASTASEPMVPRWEEMHHRPRFAVGAGQARVRYQQRMLCCIRAMQVPAQCTADQRRVDTRRHADTLAFVAGCELPELLRGSCGSKATANGVTGSASAGGLLAMHPSAGHPMGCVCSGHVEGSSFLTNKEQKKNRL